MCNVRDLYHFPSLKTRVLLWLSVFACHKVSLRKHLHVSMHFCIFSKAEFCRSSWGVMRTASSVELLSPPLFHALPPTPPITVLTDHSPPLVSSRLSLCHPRLLWFKQSAEVKVEQKEEMEWKRREWERERWGGGRDGGREVPPGFQKPAFSMYQQQSRHAAITVGFTRISWVINFDYWCCFVQLLTKHSVIIVVITL